MLVKCFIIASNKNNYYPCFRVSDENKEEFVNKYDFTY